MSKIIYSALVENIVIYGILICGGVYNSNLEILNVT